MHKADLQHPTLQDKLEYIYQLKSGEKIDLGFREPYLKLLEALGNPHENLPPIIHVAGTNGKGSVIAILRAMLEAGGYKVHAYTSPHLLRFNERIVLAGEEIDDAFLEQLMDQAVHLNQNHEITFFEMTNAIAFKAFSMIQADIVLLEVGLGGRLDCTNIIPKPAVSVINAISLDHCEFLGNSYSKIANEKSGIFKNSASCICGHQAPEAIENGVENVFIETARDKNAPLYLNGRDWTIEHHNDHMVFTFDQGSVTHPIPNLIGSHQVQNAGLALGALELIKVQFPLTHQQKSLGLQNIQWKGRLERMHHLETYGREIWYDGGHNDSAGEALADQAAQWQKNDNKPFHLIVGMKANKDFERFLNPLMPYTQSLTIIPVSGVGETLAAESCKNLQNSIKAHNSLEGALKNMPKNARILICGSLYLAQDLEKIINLP